MGPVVASLLQGHKPGRRQGTGLRLLARQFLPSWQAHPQPTPLLLSQGKSVIFSQFLSLVVLLIPPTAPNTHRLPEDFYPAGCHLPGLPRTRGLPSLPVLALEVRGTPNCKEAAGAASQFSRSWKLGVERRSLGIGHP